MTKKKDKKGQKKEKPTVLIYTLRSIEEDHIDEVNHKKRAVVIQENQKIYEDFRNIEEQQIKEQKIVDEV